MEEKKRKADVQITPEDAEYEPKNVNETEKESSHVVASKIETEVTPVVSAGFGFAAYSKVNPFAAAIANGTASGFKSGFGTADMSLFGNNKLFGKVDAPAPLVVPSPRSPKVNPFSSPSPAHNPFMTIVESKDDLWKTMAKDNLSADEAAKGFFSDDKYLSKSTGGGSSLVSSDKQHVSRQEDDEDGEDNGEDEEQRSESPTFVKYSMPEVAVVTGEEEEFSVLQVRAKLFRLSTGAKLSSSAIKNKTSLVPDITAPSVTDLSDATKETATSTTDDKSDAIKSDAIKSDTAKDTAPSVPAVSSSSMSSDLFSSLLAGIVQESSDSSSSRNQKEEAHGKQKGGGAAEWVEVGIGPVKILQSTTGETGRLVMRREEKKGGIGTKLLLNVRLNKFVSVTRQTDKVVRLICINFAEEQEGACLQTYLLKTKNAEESDKLVEIVSLFTETEDGPAEPAPSPVEQQQVLVDQKEQQQEQQ